MLEMLKSSNSATLAVLAFIAAGLLMFRRWTASIQRAREAVAESSPAARPRSAAPVDVSAKTSQLEVQLHDRGREILAQIDTRLALLQQYTRAADEAAERLERVMERQPNNSSG